MTGWIVAGIMAIGLLAGGWCWLLIRRQARQLRRQLNTAEQLLEQVQAEEDSLRTQQTAMGMAVTEALLTMDAQRRITWANPAARKLFGPLLGQTLIEATRSYELDSLLDVSLIDEVLVRQVTLGSHTFGVRLATVSADASIVMALEDISELQRLGRARRDFVANISHELRTPLASIRLLVDTLQAGALSDPQIAPDMLTKINLEVDVLSQLARELLDLALIESGQMPLKLAYINLCELVQAQIERFLPQAQQKDITLQADMLPCLYALADKEMIGRALSNLIHNALKFTPAGGSIRLGVGTEGDNVTVSVSDSGPGIPPEALERIFERFYKLDRARGGQSGTGLGLAVARHIVEGHGGRIWAESEAGRGATFYFTLPAG